MGMFDDVRCDYPLPVAGANALSYQTKDTPEQRLYRYVITDDGRLKHQETDYDEPKESPWIWDGDYTGEIRFYDCGDKGGWIEFSAYFVRGVLKELHLIKNDLLLEAPAERSPEGPDLEPGAAERDSKEQIWRAK